MLEEREIEEMITEMIDEQDTAQRRGRTVRWKDCMEPTPETDAEEWARETKERSEAK